MRNPLSIEEVPLEFKHLFNYELQAVHPRPSGTRGDAKITAYCQDCTKTFWMLVGSIRRTLKRGGKLLGLCEECKQGRTWTNSDGYVMMWAPNHPNARADGSILQHIYVMSNHLDRPLEPHENVHHKDGNRQNNSLSNLELWSTFQLAGQRVEDKVQWAVEIKRLYPEEFKKHDRKNS